MKKVLAICLIVAMVACMNVNVLAARGGFLNSPSGNRPPILVQFDPVDDDCTGTVVVTPFGDRQNQTDDVRKALEDAYDSIADNEDLTKLNDDLAKEAADKGIPGDKLGVSDLFNIHTENCEDHTDDHQFNITLDADTLKDFVGLIYQDSEGNWHWVPDAKVTGDGDHLQFTAIGSGAYAVVVDTRDSSSSSKTGDTATILICSTIMVVSAAALVAIIVKSKKKSA